MKEENGGITIEDRKKNTIKIDTSGDNILITANKDVTITAGETMTLNAKNLNINVEENTNVNVKDSANIDVGKNIKQTSTNLEEVINDKLSLNIGKNFNCKSGDIDIETFKGDIILKSASKALLQGADDARVSKG